MTIKHIVFDWDGTLADTIPLLKKAYDYTFDSLGLPRITYDEVKVLAGKYSNKNIFQSVFGETNAEQARKSFYKFIDENHLKYLVAFDGAETILKYCNNAGISCHILTNKTRRYLDAEIKQLGWEKYFQKILGAGEKEFDKPNAETCMSLFNNKQPDSQEMLVLGDGDADAAMADVWDCDCVIVDANNKYKGRPARYYIKNLNEFIPLLKQLNS